MVSTLLQSSSKHLAPIPGTTYVHNTNKYKKKGNSQIFEIKTMLNITYPATKSPPKKMLASLVRKLRQLPNRKNQIPSPTNGISYNVDDIIAILEIYQDSYRLVSRGIGINHFIKSGHLKGGRSTI